MSYWWEKSQEELRQSQAQVDRDVMYLFGRSTMTTNLNSSGYLAVNIEIIGNSGGKQHPRLCLWDKRRFWGANPKYTGQAYTIGEVTGIRIEDTYYTLLAGELLRQVAVTDQMKATPIYDLVMETVMNIRDFEDYQALL